ncbi:MAG TPA: NADH-quinone oxidoreductase subunit L [Candidatus Gastranaerophilales bacterium]|nr:NADH-quinone oxidoreductase subunit L [Candidatus Gastranaerophilales bacterium]
MDQFLEFFIENAGIIAALPLWTFLIIIFGQNLGVYDNKKITVWLTCASTFIGFLWALFIFLWTLGAEEPFTKNIAWINAGNIQLSFGWLLDNLAAVMLLVVTSVSLLIQIYSHGYMNKDEGYHRFFSYLNLFNFSMLGLVLSSNLFQIYIFWELVGLSSYLLIGFWYRRPSAAHAATKAFIINRIGDCGLLIGIISFLFFSLNWWAASGDVYLSFTSLQPAAEYVLTSAGPIVYFLIATAIFLGPMAKSAQFPLHTWLPDAMEGPTPISALIHAATMVAAGVFLIARAYPVFEASSCVMTTIAWIGGITAFITATIALTQYDLKKTLAYSTCSQLGFMVMAMGAGAFAAGLFHLVTHAYFKAMLFLCSGTVIHGLNDQQDMRFMGGLRKHMPVVAYTYLIGCLAISGILLSGFWSKEEIFSGLYAGNNVSLLSLGLIVAFMTAFYMFRTYFLTFEGQYKGHTHPHNSPKVMTVPLILLAIPSALLGIMLSGKFFLPSFDKYIIAGKESFIHLEHNENLLLPVISILIALSGVLTAAFFFWDGFKEKRESVKITADNVIKSAKPIYALTTNLWYIDKFYYAFIDKVFLPICNFISRFDKYIIDGLVNLTATKIRFEGWVLRQFQTGQIQTYLAIMFAGLIGLVLIFVLLQLLLI